MCAHKPPHCPQIFIFKPQKVTEASSSGHDLLGHRVEAEIKHRVFAFSHNRVIDWCFVWCFICISIPISIPDLCCRNLPSKSSERPTGRICRQTSPGCEPFERAGWKANSLSDTSTLIASSLAGRARMKIDFRRPFAVEKSDLPALHPESLAILISHCEHPLRPNQFLKPSMIAISDQPSIVKIAHSNIYWWCHESSSLLPESCWASSSRHKTKANICL